MDQKQVGQLVQLDTNSFDNTATGQVPVTPDGQVTWLVTPPGAAAVLPTSRTAATVFLMAAGFVTITPHYVNADNSSPAAAPYKVQVSNQIPSYTVAVPPTVRVDLIAARSV